MPSGEDGSIPSWSKIREVSFERAELSSFAPLLSNWRLYSVFSSSKSSADTVAVRNLRNGLIRLRKQLAMPGSLLEAGVDPRQVQLRQRELTEKILADPCCENNPAEVADFMVKQILEGVAR